MPEQRKSIPLRISKELYDQLHRWSTDEMRSVNAQIEYLLRDAVNRRKKSRNDPNREKKK